jgi:lipopolysaccharide export system permease protein
MPFLSAAIVVSLLVALISAYVSPLALRELRTWAAKIRADLVATIIQPGRFTTIERGLTFHIRERRVNGELKGIFIDDRRDPKERSTFVAERGDILENARGSFLVLDKGSVQRIEPDQRDPTLVVFERYAFDLSRFTSAAVESRSVSARERYVWNLLSPDPKDPMFIAQPGMFRAEFHDRIAAPLYPLAFAIVIYAFLGMPATTRQGRGIALALAIVTAAGLRFVGFGSAILAAHTPIAIAILYGSVIAAIALGLVAISRGFSLEAPAFLNKSIAALSERFIRTAATT